MSVINKMLRDLDARRASSALPGREAPGGLMRDTATVKPGSTGGEGGARLKPGLLVALILVLGLAAAWWYGQTPEAPPLPARPLKAITSMAAPVAAPAPLPTAASSGAVAPSLPTTAQASGPLGPQQLNQMLDQVATSPQAAALPAPPVVPDAVPGVSAEQKQQMLQQLGRNMPGGQLAPPAQLPGLAYELQQQLAKPAPGVAAAPARSPAPTGGVVQPAPTPRAAPVPVPSRQSTAGSAAAPLAVQPEPRHKGTPKTEAVVAQAAPEPASVPQAGAAALPKTSAAASKAPVGAKPPRPAEPMSAANPRQAAALETLAQARNLWNAGSRDAALELMRDAVAVAERATAAAEQPVALTTFQTLVRELARMELAQGQVRQVLELLVRLEPLVADQADLWAVRGNAAQRLGQHAESVNAYGMALKLRPGESRWMLAMAVSLAAQGQLSAAAEQAEKARSAGAVSPDVLAYLRQLGVPLR